MILYVIYNPKARNEPGVWVVREWYKLPGQISFLPSPDRKMAETLAEAREMVPADSIQLNRCPEDDPVIEEVWVGRFEGHPPLFMMGALNEILAGTC